MVTVDGTGSWPVGAAATVRFGRLGTVRSAVTARVVADGSQGLVLWVPPGAPRIEQVLPDGRDLRSLPVGERAGAARVRRAGTWSGPGVVWLVPAGGAPWSVWWFFRPGGAFDHWYGNLEAPQRRWTTPAGSLFVDTADRALDVVVGPDGVSRWKDEDEFAAFTGGAGRWTAEQAVAIRADGEELRRRASACEAPFDGRWTDFAPDPAWALPALPDDWDLPHDTWP